MEVALDLHTQRVAGTHEIFQNHVDYVFVKYLYLPKRIDVKLQTLQFDAAFVGNILETYGGKIGEIREGADGREFSHLEIDLYFAAGEFIRECVQRVKIHLFARRRANVEVLLVRGGKIRICRLHDAAPYKSPTRRGRPSVKNVTSTRPAMKPPICAKKATPPCCDPPPSTPSPLIS